MRRIIKLAPPTSLLTYIGKRNPEDPAYLPTYDGLDTKEIDDLKTALLNEQGWVCGYCMQKINKDNMSIEHHCEQTICNGENGTTDRTLDYTNMLAVCSGKRAKELHCDTKKSQFNEASGLPMRISPLIEAHMSTISYTTTGYVKSSNTAVYDNEINRFLNLNTPYLRELRGRKFREIFKISKSSTGTTNFDKMRRILEKDLQIGNNKFSNNFPGLSEYLLNRYC
ncbi:hypothetical protein [Flavobacterium sp.]|uniref:hypothetical protein n=1 Tax=Flavobacterium sp. TaxID=239 RepID=UPI00262AB95A|nr:hypothetical protein [Flavobacterium sp.]